MHKTSTAYLTPAGASKLTGGADPSSVHFHIDFTASGIDSLRQAWLTFAPALKLRLRVRQSRAGRLSADLRTRGARVHLREVYKHF
jgi:hypothetical protein